ncbi:MAG: AAA family ATPase [Candidatus Lokiarchaeota archaeon]|nr:AAA family ATPase [Candidatus Lokiarchaeota archaeon]
MFRKFYINNFRCFNTVVVDGLKGFNIIIGKNNVGKTAFLESLFLHIGTHNPEITFRIDSFRGEINQEFNALSLWSPLFHNLDTQRPIVLISYDELTRKLTSEISIVGIVLIATSRRKMREENRNK